MKLHLAETTVQRGSVLVQWCVNKATLEALKRLDCHDPQLLLITAPKRNGESHFSHLESRKIVPLHDLKAYVDFRAPGENNIFAIILWDAPKESRNKYLRRTDGSWHTGVLNEDGKLFPDYIDFDDQLTGRSDMIAVDVPKECFAKEPPKWEQEWVNRWWDNNPPRDQCEYRKRRIMAYSVQPILYLLLFAFLGASAYALAWVVGIALTLAGIRGFNYKLLVWPFPAFENGPAIEDWDIGDLDGSYFLPKNKRTWVRFITFPFTPIFLGIAFLVLKFGMKLKLTTAILLSFVGAAGIAAVVAVVGSILTLAALGIIAAIKARIKQQKKDLWYLEDQQLVCDNETPGVKNIPWGRRSIRLIFSGFKARACRPFAS